MAWKKDESGLLAVDDNGNPVWIFDSGEEKGIDHAQTLKRLGEVKAESRSRKEELRTLREKLAPFDGIEDMADFRKRADEALEAMKNQPEKDRELAAQIAAKVESATAEFRTRLAEKDKKLAEEAKKTASLQDEVNRMKVGACVRASKLLMERLAPEDRVFMERELLRSGTIGEDGKVVFRDDAGEILRNEQLEPCNVDEAIPAILKKLGIDPEKKFLSLDNGSGSGARPDSQGHKGIKNPWKQETMKKTRLSPKVFRKCLHCLARTGQSCPDFRFRY